MWVGRRFGRVFGCREEGRGTGRVSVFREGIEGLCVLETRQAGVGPCCCLSRIAGTFGDSGMLHAQGSVPSTPSIVITCLWSPAHGFGFSP